MKGAPECPPRAAGGWSNRPKPESARFHGARGAGGGASPVPSVVRERILRSVNPLGFSPALLRGGAESLDPTDSTSTLSLTKEF